MTRSLMKSIAAHRGIILKTLAALCLPLFIFMMIGCVPEEPPVQAEVGPEVSISEINTALDDIMGTFDLSMAKAGESTIRYVSKSAPGFEAEFTSGSNVEVLSITESEASTDFNFAYVNELYKNNKPYETNGREFLLSCSKTDGNCYVGGLPTTTVLSVSDLKPSPARLSELSASAEEQAPITTYHNLKVTRASATPPPKVVESADCRGLSPCELDIVSVSYDTVLTFPSGERTIYNTTIKSSNQIPLFARYKIALDDAGALALSFTPLSVCHTTAGGGLTPVSFCEDVADFLPGR